MNRQRYYRCSLGHDLAAPEGRELDRCPAYRQGQPCAGGLFAVDAAGRRRPTEKATEQ